MQKALTSIPTTTGSSEHCQGVPANSWTPLGSVCSGNHKGSRESNLGQTHIRQTPYPVYFALAPMFWRAPGSQALLGEAPVKNKIETTPQNYLQFSKCRKSHCDFSQGPEIKNTMSEIEQNLTFLLWGKGNLLSRNSIWLSSVLMHTALNPWVGAMLCWTLFNAKEWRRLVFPAPSNPNTRICLFLSCEIKEIDKLMLPRLEF